MYVCLFLCLFVCWPVCMLCSVMLCYIFGTLFYVLLSYDMPCYNAALCCVML